MLGVWLMAGLARASGVSPPVLNAGLEQAAAAIDEGRYSDALALVAAAETLSLEQQDGDWAAYLRARILVATGKTDEALGVIRARQRLHPNAYNWASVVSIHVTGGLHEEAARLILALDDGAFLLANRLRRGLVESLLNALEARQSPQRDALVARLVEGRYTGPSGVHVPDMIRLRYIGLLLRQNRPEAAAQETVALESPLALSLLLADRTFSALWSHAAVRRIQGSGALVARVERGIQARLEQPHLHMSDWLEMMRALRMIGRPDEAVRLGLSAIDKARSGQMRASAALRLEVGHAYADMGEAWAARRTARELQKELSTLPAGLRVEIADLLERAEDDEGAMLMLGTLAGIEALPGALKVQACAAHDLGRSERRDAALAQLEQLGAPLDRLHALLCTGRQAQARDLLVAMLDMPEQRATAILMAQLFEDGSRPGTDVRDFAYRHRALVASEAVQTALLAQGRSLGLPFATATAPR
jgi:tetratricopeptide (TPR) repeat protein